MIMGQGTDDYSLLIYQIPLDLAFYLPNITGQSRSLL